MAPNETTMTVFNASCRDLKSVVTNWTAINAKELQDFNATLAKNSLPAITAATPGLPTPACAQAQQKR